MSVGLPACTRGAVTPVWVDRPGQPMHMVLVSRREHDDGLVMVETQYRGSAVPIVDFPALTTVGRRCGPVGWWIACAASGFVACAGG